jgi:hypothetical protein
MKRILTMAATAALLMPATASAYHAAGDSGAAAKTNSLIAKSNQSEGRLAPNACSTAQTFTVSGPADISVLAAGTNAGGHLFAEVIGRAGDVGSENGYYRASAPGTYGYRVCFRSDDGIDSTISYVSSVVVSPG